MSSIVPELTSLIMMIPPFIAHSKTFNDRPALTACSLFTTLLLPEASKNKSRSRRRKVKVEVVEMEVEVGIEVGINFGVK